MGLFGKKRDVLDLTDMQNRGLLDVPPKNEEDIIDFSRESDSDPGSSAGGFDFLSGLAGAGKSQPEYPSPGPVTSSLRNARRRIQTDSQVSELKLKVEDNEFKIKQLNEKIRELESLLRESRR